MSWVIVGGAASSIIGGLVGSNQAKKAAKRAEQAAQIARAELKKLKSQRMTITNPYASSTNLSSLAVDLTSNLNNPYASLGVATQAAEIQMEQSDIALANTLDTLKATGASAGGATALAMAALQSKKGVAANIEQNEKLRAQGEMQLNQQKMSEQQRLQGIAISEGQRLQATDAAGKQFMFQASETRLNMDMNRAAGQLQQAAQSRADANAAQASAVTGTVAGLTRLAGSAITGAAQRQASGQVNYGSSGYTNRNDWRNAGKKAKTEK